MKITIIPPQYIPSLGKAAYFIGRYFKMSEIAKTYSPVFQPRESQRFPSMLKNTPRTLVRGVFDKRNHDVTIVTSNLDHGKPLRSYDIIDPELKVIRLKSFEKRGKIITPSLHSVLKKIDTDVFLATEGLATYSYYVTAKVAKKRNIPLALIADWWGTDFSGRGLKKLYTTLFKVPKLNIADKIFVYDETVKSALAKSGVKIEKLQILSNGSDFDLFSSGNRKKGRELLNLSQDDIVILSIGRVIKCKNFEFLIDFIDTSKSKYKNLKLAIIGPVIDKEYYEFLVKYVDRLNLKDIVSFHHITDYSNLPHVYAAGDIFAFASKSEGWPLVIPEAMAAGLPIISTPVGVIPEIIKKAECGFTLANKDDYYKSLISLIEDKKLRAKLGNNAGKSARQYSWSRIAEQIEKELYKLRNQIFTMDLEEDINAGLRFSRLLHKHKIKGEFYICGYLAEKYPEECKEIAKHHVISGHGYNHENFARLSASEQERLIKKTIEIFKKNKINLQGWRFPGLNFENKSLNILSKFNLYDSSIREPALRKWGRFIFIRNWLVNLKNKNLSFPSLIGNVKEKPWSVADLNDPEFYTKNGRLICHCYNLKNFEKGLEGYLNGLEK